MKDKLSFMGKTRDELIEENQKLKEHLENLQYNYNKVFNDRLKLKRKLEESKKRVIDLEKCIELGLEADGIIEKVKEVNKW